VPLEAIADLSTEERTISLEASVEPHRVPRHRSVRRLANKWRVDLTLDAPPMDPEYWLGHCHGFLVNSPTADIGVIDGVMLGAAVESWLEIAVPRRLVPRAGDEARGPR
jgi:hypothetical protein